MQAKTFITSQEAAVNLGVSVSRVYALIRRKRLPAVRFGTAWMIDPKDLDAVRVRPTGRPRKKT